MPPDATAAPTAPAAAAPANGLAVNPRVSLEETPAAPGMLVYDGGPAAPAPAAVDKPVDSVDKPPAEAEKKPDPDDLVLQLSQRTRAASEAEKRATARETEAKAALARVQRFEAIMGKAKTEPLEFLNTICDAAGLDLDLAIEAYTTHKAGGKRELTTDEKLARLERDRTAETEKQERERKEQEKRDGEAQLAKMHEQIRGFANAAAENFPLFNDDPTSNSVAAFDLIALHHAEKPDEPMLTIAAAVQMIEKTLYAETERRAGRLGFKKAEAAPPTPTTTPVPQAAATPTPAAAPAPRQTQTPQVPAPAPAESLPAIRSDDDIAADWASFRR